LPVVPSRKVTISQLGNRKLIDSLECQRGYDDMLTSQEGYLRYLLYKGYEYREATPMKINSSPLKKKSPGHFSGWKLFNFWCFFSGKNCGAWQNTKGNLT